MSSPVDRTALNRACFAGGHVSEIEGPCPATARTMPGPKKKSPAPPLGQVRFKNLSFSKPASSKQGGKKSKRKAFSFTTVDLKIGPATSRRGERTTSPVKNPGHHFSGGDGPDGRDFFFYPAVSGVWSWVTPGVPVFLPDPALPTRSTAPRPRPPSPAPAEDDGRAGRSRLVRATNLPVAARRSFP